MIDVEKSKFSPHLACVFCGECLHMCRIHVFCCKNGFVAMYALLLKICFVATYALLCGEKLTKNYVCGEKMTNMRYAEIQRQIQIKTDTCVQIDTLPGFKRID